jgi:anti-sigma factor RsiW
MTHLPPQPNSNTDDDILLLSAYIDDALTADERATLEQRLSADPALRDELESLRTTASLLHDLPSVAPPRSFTLDPEQVQPRRSFLASPIFTGSMGLLRFGGVAAALVLAVAVTALVYTGQITGMPEQAAEAPPLPQTTAPASAGAPEAGMMRQGTAAPPAMADAPAGDAPPPDEQAATLMEEEAAEEAAPEEAAPEEAIEEAEEEFAADEAAPAEADDEAAAALLPTPASTPPPEGAIVATQEAAELAEEAETSVVEQENAASTARDLEDDAPELEAEPAPASTTPLPLLVVGALLTLALLGAGWFIWQRQRR